MAYLQQGRAQEERKGCRCVGRWPHVTATTDPCWTTPSAGDGKGVWLSYSRAWPKSRQKTVDALVDDHACMLGDGILYQQQQIFVGRPLVLTMWKGV